MKIYKCKITHVGNDPRLGDLHGWVASGENHPDSVGSSVVGGGPTTIGGTAEWLYGGRTVDELIEIYDLCKSGYKE